MFSLDMSNDYHYTTLQGLSSVVYQCDCTSTGFEGMLTHTWYEQGRIKEERACNSLYI